MSGQCRPSGALWLCGGASGGSRPRLLNVAPPGLVNVGPPGLLNVAHRGLGYQYLWVALVLAALCPGCGTTRRTDTTRTATEQMLLSDAVDRAISRIDFGLLAGKEVYLDGTYLGSAVDKEYITSTLRQHMLACGCVLKDKKEDASLVVEVRSGVVGTDRNDLLFGTPATTVSLGALSPLPGTPTMVPEIALAKRTDQMGVAKIAVFAYERESGVPVWQSGSDIVASRSRDLWVFGAGPFQRGTIYDGPKFAGEELRVPLVGGKKNDRRPPVRVARERVFNPAVLAKKDAPSKGQVAQGSTEPAAAPSAPPAAGRSTTVAGVQEESGITPPTQSELFAAPAISQPAASAVVSTAGQEAAAHAYPARSQFDPVWAPLPEIHAEDSSANTANRSWPAISQMR